MTVEPPAAEAPPERGERLGLAEWAVGLSLLVASLIGPWLTLTFPAAVVFAAYDRRRVTRAVAAVVAALSALLALAAPGGAALIAMAGGAVVGSVVAVARGRRSTLDGLALPSLGGAAAGLGLAWLAAPSAARAWEAMLLSGVSEGGQAALARYRDLGMDPETLASLERLLTTVAVWTVRLWPAVAALTLWLGVWFGWRLFARWGRAVEEVTPRTAGAPFTELRVGVSTAWLLVLGLAGLWVPALERGAANLALVAATLAAADGAAVLWWWLDRRGAGVVIRIVGMVVVTVFALPLAAAGTLALGLLDVWLEFRDR